MLNCAIIGTGAAGVSAALTLKALKRDFLLIGNASLSNKIRTAERIKNYPGLGDVSGEKLCNAFKSQLLSEGIEITEERVNGVYPATNGYSVMCGQNVYEVKSVILATGVESFKPIAGETEFLGRGVSYCATCDGFLYKGKSIAVIAESAEDIHEVELLAKYAERVYLFFLGKPFKVSLPNVQAMDGRVVEIVGDMRAKGVIHSGGQLEIDGVFVLKNSYAAGVLVHGLVCKDGVVAVDRACATNLPGVFAAGDCTGRPYQYAKAVGEGNVAAHSVNAYLNTLK